MKNERTSKKVAAQAGQLLATITVLERTVAKLAKQVRSVAGSALTQAADKRRKS